MEWEKDGLNDASELNRRKCLGDLENGGFLVAISKIFSYNACRK